MQMVLKKLEMWSCETCNMEDECKISQYLHHMFLFPKSRIQLMVEDETRKGREKSEENALNPSQHPLLQPDRQTLSISSTPPSSLRSFPTTASSYCAILFQVFARMPSTDFLKGTYYWPSFRMMDNM
jgi:hypothetical protein